MSMLEDQAQRAEDEGNFEEAFTLWRQLAIQTRDAIDFCRAGRAAQELEWWSEAEEAFKDALRVDPMSSEAMECMGSLFLSRTDGLSPEHLQRARAWFERALKITQSARLLTFLGGTYAALEDQDAAKRAFNEAVRIDPAYEEAYYNLAVLERCNDPLSSQKLLEKAIELDPDYAMAHQDLGNLVQEAGDTLRAEYHYRRCIEIDSADFWSRLYLANVFAVQGRFEEAEKEYRTAIALHPAEDAGYKFFADFLD